MDFKLLENDLKIIKEDIRSLEKDPGVVVLFEDKPGIEVQFSHTSKGYDVWTVNEEHALFLLEDTDPCDNRVKFKFMLFYYEKMAYAKSCGKVSRKLNIPFELSLAFGPELSREYSILVKNLVVQKEELREVEHVLSNCGIERRKNMIHQLLNDGSERLHEKVESMGQKHSSRVAYDLLKVYMMKVRFM